MLEARYGFATRTILTLFAVTLIYGCSQARTEQQPAQAQGKGAVCQSNVQQLEKVVDGMDTQRGSQKNEVEGSLRNAKAQDISVIRRVHFARVQCAEHAEHPARCQGWRKINGGETNMLKIASLFAPAAVALLVATSAGAQALDPAKPGVVEADVVQLQATVAAVDRASHHAVTLRGKDGREVEVTLSDQVKNFDQIKVGDTVTATMYEATAIFVRKAEGKPAAVEAGVVQVARPGDKPGGISTDVTQITATVEDIDTAKRIVKLKGPEGKIRVLKVGSDVKNLAAVKKGDQVVVRHTEEVAIDVTE